MNGCINLRALFGAAWLGFSLAHAAPVLSVFRSQTASTNLLRNGAFESVRADGTLADWQSSAKGYAVGNTDGRGASRALVCVNPTGEGWVGASQTLTLNRTNAAPFVVRGWSKAENVSGGADSDYSLYVDLIYADGTPLWGQTASFHCGTHDWEPREFMILPDKPVKTLTLHCLFRNHAGKVWFDDVSVAETVAPHGAFIFQGVPVQPPAATPAGRRWWDVLGRAAGGPGAGQRPAANEVVRDWRVQFLVRDVAQNSDFFAFDRGVCRELNLRLITESTSRSMPLAARGQVVDTTGKDRAITLVFVWPFPDAGWWGDDIRRSRVIQGTGDFLSQVNVRCGATGTMSLYPLGAVWNESRYVNESQGLAMAIDMAQPAQYRIGYHAGLKVLYLAYDFGLVKEAVSLGPPWEKSATAVGGRAGFSFVVYPFEPRWGFRAAFQKFQQIFPEYFTVRATDQGLWMPFTDISRVQAWQDFGFKFHEGDNNLPFDHDHHILSFRYTEPMTWWMPMKKDIPRTAEAALRVRDELTGGNNESQRRLAGVSRLAAMHDETGQPCLLFRNEPWCNGAVWSLNPNPFLGGERPAPGGPRTPRPGRTPPLPMRHASLATNAATIYWNDEIQERLYGPDVKGGLAGEYLDSLEGYVTADLNFRREHFRYTTVPLTFSSESKQPALFKGLAVFEFTKWFCDGVHRLGRLTFANGVPYRFTFLCPWLDVMGTETDWLSGGRYRPSSDGEMCLWRTMAGAKPYLLLMNTDFDRFTPDLVERYFQRALFYGMWPGFFSHNAADNPYWQNPKWYNRDRPLFQKYLPLIKRVAEAGWQPITDATCRMNTNLWVERYGPDAAGSVYFTLYNDSDEAQDGALEILEPAFGSSSSAILQDLISGRTRERTQTRHMELLRERTAAGEQRSVERVRTANTWPVHVEPHQVLVFEGKQ